MWRDCKANAHSHLHRPKQATPPVTPMVLFPFLAFPICLQDSRTRERVAIRMDARPRGSCCEYPASEATARPGQRGAHRSSSLKRVRLCFRMCSSRTCPRCSRVRRACFSPCRPPWLSQNTGSVCSDLSSIFCRQPDWRTFTTDSGNLDSGPPSAGTKRESKSDLREFPRKPKPGGQSLHGWGAQATSACKVARAMPTAQSSGTLPPAQLRKRAGDKAFGGVPSHRESGQINSALPGETPPAALLGKCQEEPEEG